MKHLTRWNAELELQVRRAVQAVEAWSDHETWLESLDEEDPEVA